METLQILNVAPTKSNIADYVGKIKATIDNGEANPLDLIVQLEGVKSICEEARKAIEENILNELSKYGKGEKVVFGGAEIEPAQVGTKYDFTVCGDTELEELEKQFAEIDAKLKARKEFLKTVPSTGLDIADRTSGEMICIYPPAKQSKDGFKIKLGK